MDGRTCGLCGGAAVVLDGELGPLMGPLYRDKEHTQPVWVHRHCALWSPECYLTDAGVIKGALKEVRRGRALPCSACGRTGATLGCRYSSCPATFHLPCALLLACHLSHRDHLLTCSTHSKEWYQREGPGLLLRVYRTGQVTQVPHPGALAAAQGRTWVDGAPQELLLASAAAPNPRKRSRSPEAADPPAAAAAAGGAAGGGADVFAAGPGWGSAAADTGAAVTGAGGLAGEQGELAAGAGGAAGRRSVAAAGGSRLPIGARPARGLSKVEVEMHVKAARAALRRAAAAVAARASAADSDGEEEEAIMAAKHAKRLAKAVASLAPTVLHGAAAGPLASAGSQVPDSGAWSLGASAAAAPPPPRVAGKALHGGGSAAAFDARHAKPGTLLEWQLPSQRPSAFAAAAGVGAEGGKEAAVAPWVPPADGFCSIGGLDSIKQQLWEMVLLPLLQPQLVEALAIEVPRGLLLHGPPGVGKTAVVRALAAEVAARSPRPVALFARKGSDCLGKYAGDAEHNLRLLFQMAADAAPSIVFLDELDALVPARRGVSSTSDQIHASVVSVLLALLDGVAGRGEVLVVGATNRPDSIDPALRRPGRFDREVHLPLPDAAARGEILRVLTRRWSPPPDAALLQELAAATDGMAGADLASLTAGTLLAATRRTAPNLLQQLEAAAAPPPTPAVPQTRQGMQIPEQQHHQQQQGLDPDDAQKLGAAPPPAAAAVAAVAGVPAHHMGEGSSGAAAAGAGAGAVSGAAQPHAAATPPPAAAAVPGVAGPAVLSLSQQPTPMGGVALTTPPRSHEAAGAGGVSGDGAGYRGPAADGMADRGLAADHSSTWGPSRSSLGSEGSPANFLSSLCNYPGVTLVTSAGQRPTSSRQHLRQVPAGRPAAAGGPSCSPSQEGPQQQPAAAAEEPDPGSQQEQQQQQQSAHDPQQQQQVTKQQDQVGQAEQEHDTHQQQQLSSDLQQGEPQAHAAQPAQQQQQQEHPPDAAAQAEAAVGVRLDNASAPQAAFIASNSGSSHSRMAQVAAAALSDLTVLPCDWWAALAAAGPSSSCREAGGALAATAGASLLSPAEVMLVTPALVRVLVWLGQQGVFQGLLGPSVGGGGGHTGQDASCGQSVAQLLQAAAAVAAEAERQQPVRDGQQQQQEDWLFTRSSSNGAVTASAAWQSLQQCLQAAGLVKATGPMGQPGQSLTAPSRAEPPQAPAPAACGTARQAGCQLLHVDLTGGVDQGQQEALGALGKLLGSWGCLVFNCDLSALLLRGEGDLAAGLLAAVRSAAVQLKARQQPLVLLLPDLQVLSAAADASRVERCIPTRQTPTSAAAAAVASSSAAGAAATTAAAAPAAAAGAGTAGAGMRGGAGAAAAGQLVAVLRTALTGLLTSLHQPVLLLTTSINPSTSSCSTTTVAGVAGTAAGTGAVTGSRPMMQGSAKTAAPAGQAVWQRVALSQQHLVVSVQQVAADWGCSRHSSTSSSNTARTDIDRRVAGSRTDNTPLGSAVGGAVAGVGLGWQAVLQCAAEQVSWLGAQLMADQLHATATGSATSAASAADPAAEPVYPEAPQQEQQLLLQHAGSPVTHSTISPRESPEPFATPAQQQQASVAWARLNAAQQETALQLLASVRGLVQAIGAGVMQDPRSVVAQVRCPKGVGVQIPIGARSGGTLGGGITPGGCQGNSMWHLGNWAAQGGCWSAEQLLSELRGLTESIRTSHNNKWVGAPAVAAAAALEDMVEGAAAEGCRVLGFWGDAEKQRLLQLAVAYQQQLLLQPPQQQEQEDGFLGQQPPQQQQRPAGAAPGLQQGQQDAAAGLQAGPAGAAVGGAEASHTAAAADGLGAAVGAAHSQLPAPSHQIQQEQPEQLPSAPTDAPDILDRGHCLHQQQEELVQELHQRLLPGVTQLCLQWGGVCHLPQQQGARLASSPLPAAAADGADIVSAAAGGGTQSRLPQSDLAALRLLVRKAGAAGAWQKACSRGAGA